METYFSSGNFKVKDNEDKEFAKYKVTNGAYQGAIRCFDCLDQAVLYCIGASKQKSNDSQLMAYIDSFITMINK
jgi:hypothetical protein